MKLFYGIILIMVAFISACAPQAAEPEAQPSAPVAAPEPEPEPETEGTGAAVAPPEEEAAETSTTDVRFSGAAGFDPADLTISAGSSVTWFNDDSKPFVVIIFKDGESYKAIPRIKPGQQGEYEFAESGVYSYWWNLAYAPNGGTITVE